MKISGIPAMVHMNLSGRLVRSITLSVLAAVMSASWFAGLILVPSVQGGLEMIQRRLGADIMVVPYAALSKKNYENEILSGSAVPAFMPAENMEKIAQIEGVSGVSSQICLGDVDTDLAREPVHLMGYDPQTDFCVTPWIGAYASKTADAPAAVVGSRVNAQAGDTVSLLSASVFVSGKMEETGTDLDTSIYVDTRSLLRLAEQSEDTDIQRRAALAQGNQVSSILVDVAEGYDPEPVLNSINIHIKKVRAIVSGQVIGGEASSIHGVSSAILVLTVVVGCAAMTAYAVVYVLMTAERKKEFALLRAAGASGKMLSEIVMAEGSILSVAGSAVSIGIMLVLLPAFLSRAGQAMNLPLPAPGAGRCAVCAVIAVGISVLAGMAGCVMMARRISRMDAASALREA